MTADEKLRELLRLAEEATPGPWASDPVEHRDVWSDAECGSHVCDCMWGGDAAYIAAASPDVVAALCRALIEVVECVNDVHCPEDVLDNLLREIGSDAWQGG